jgi:hypothetical protein
VQDRGGGVDFGSLAIVYMDATCWPGGGEVVGNQELHPAVWPVAWVLRLHERYKARFNLLLSFFPHVSSHGKRVVENVQVAKIAIDERECHSA